MGGALDIAVRDEHGVVIAAVTGEIDISTVAQLRKRLYELADNCGTLIVLSYVKHPSAASVESELDVSHVGRSPTHAVPRAPAYVSVTR